MGEAPPSHSSPLAINYHLPLFSPLTPYARARRGWAIMDYYSPNKPRIRPETGVVIGSEEDQGNLAGERHGQSLAAFQRMRASGDRAGMQHYANELASRGYTPMGEKLGDNARAGQADISAYLPSPADLAAREEEQRRRTEQMAEAARAAEAGQLAYGGGVPQYGAPATAPAARYAPGSMQATGGLAGPDALSRPVKLGMTTRDGAVIDRVLAQGNRAGLRDFQRVRQLGRFHAGDDAAYTPQGLAARAAADESQGRMGLAAYQATLKDQADALAWRRGLAEKTGAASPRDALELLAREKQLKLASDGVGLARAGVGLDTDRVNLDAKRDDEAFYRTHNMTRTQGGDLVQGVRKREYETKNPIDPRVYVDAGTGNRYLIDGTNTMRAANPARPDEVREVAPGIKVVTVGGESRVIQGGGDPLATPEVMKDPKTGAFFYRSTKGGAWSPVKVDSLTEALNQQSSPAGTPTNENPYTKTGGAPGGATGGTAELEALAWLRANPNDPRAPGVRKKLGI